MTGRNPFSYLIQGTLLFGNSLNVPFPNPVFNNIYPSSFLYLLLFLPLFLLPSLFSFHVHFFLNLAVEFENSVRSPLATINPKLRWEFFAPAGKTPHSLAALVFVPTGAEDSSSVVFLYSHIGSHDSFLLYYVILLCCLSVCYVCGSLPCKVYIQCTPKYN